MLVKPVTGAADKTWGRKDEAAIKADRKASANFAFLEMPAGFFFFTAFLLMLNRAVFKTEKRLA